MRVTGGNGTGAGKTLRCGYVGADRMKRMQPELLLHHNRRASVPFARMRDTATNGGGVSKWPRQVNFTSQLSIIPRRKRMRDW